MDHKVHAAQIATGDVLAKMNSDIDALKGKKSVDASCSSGTSSATPSSAPAQIYGMPLNLFVGQTAQPSLVYTEPVTPVPATGQTGAMVANPPSPTPLASIPSSAAPGRTNEMVLYSSPHAAAGSAPQESGPHYGPIPNASQTMSYTNPSTHHLAFASHAYTGSNYQADLLKFKEDLANIIKSKLGVDLGSSCLYQKPYPPEFDFVSYPTDWPIPEFVKFNGDDSRTT